MRSRRSEAGSLGRSASVKRGELPDRLMERSEVLPGRSFRVVQEKPELLRGGEERVVRAEPEVEYGAGSSPWEEGALDE